MNQPDDKRKRGSHPLYDTPAPPDGDDADDKRGVSVQLPGITQTPYLTYVLVALNAALFAVRYFDETLAIQLYDWGIAYTDLIANGELYRLVSAMFLHGDEMHLFFNMLALYYIGGNIERIFGHVRFALVYFIGGLVGSAAIVLVGSNGLGASGAVFAVWGAEAVYFYKNWSVYGEYARQRLVQSGIFMGLNFVFGFVANAAATIAPDEASLRISNAAHLGGLIGGAVVAWIIAPLYHVERKVATLTRPPQADDFHIERRNDLAERWREVLGVVAGVVLLTALAILLQRL